MLIARIDGDQYELVNQPPAGFKRLTETFSNIRVAPGFQVELHSGKFWDPGLWGPSTYNPNKSWYAEVAVFSPPVPDSRKPGETVRVRSIGSMWRSDTKAVLLDVIRAQLYENVTHEMDEWLRYRDELPFDPHA